MPPYRKRLAFRSYLTKGRSQLRLGDRTVFPNTARMLRELRHGARRAQTATWSDNAHPYDGCQAASMPGEFTSPIFPTACHAAPQPADVS